MNFKFSHRENGFATHQPVLYVILKLTSGPVIEFGCGEGSTELIHELCKKEKRKVISLDDNFEWLQKHKEKYESEQSKFIYVPKSNTSDPEDASHWQKILKTEEIGKTDWDVVFIDQSPWMARYYTLLTFKDTAQYIIIHDCDYFPDNNIFGKTIKRVNRKKGKYLFDDVFKYYKIYYPLKPWPYNITGPPTLLGSNIVSKLPKIKYKKF